MVSGEEEIRHIIESLKSGGFGPGPFILDLKTLQEIRRDILHEPDIDDGT